MEVGVKSIKVSLILSGGVAVFLWGLLAIILKLGKDYLGFHLNKGIASYVLIALIVLFGLLICYISGEYYFVTRKYLMSLLIPLIYLVVTFIMAYLFSKIYYLGTIVLFIQPLIVFFVSALVNGVIFLVKRNS